MKTRSIICYFLLGIIPALQAQYAPVTTAGRVTDATPGDPSVGVDITVEDFNNIGQFTLTLQFDTVKIHYVSGSTTEALSGMSLSYIHPSGNTQGKIVMSWTGAANTSLSDNAVLASLQFHYISGTGLLNWAYTYGSICQYKRYVGTVLTSLNDNPKYQFYINGGIANRGAPVVYALDIEDPQVGEVFLPVVANDFTSIGALTLYLEYDPAFLMYAAYTKNPAFDSNFLVGDNPGINGNRFIVIQWYGASLSLDDGDTLCTIEFNYTEADCDQSPVNWYDIGPSCEFADGNSEVLIDMPQGTYYFDGVVQAGLPVTWTGNQGNSWDDPGNWDDCGTPDSLRHVVIPDVSPNPFPVISGVRHCRSVQVNNGASLTLSAGGVLMVKE